LTNLPDGCYGRTVQQEYLREDPIWAKDENLGGDGLGVKSTCRKASERKVYHQHFPRR